EQLLRAVDGELLDLVDDLAAAVVPLPRIALCVLVRRRRPDRLEDRGPGEVLGRDQLDLAALPLRLAVEQFRNLGVDLVESGSGQLLERLLGDGHRLSSPGVRVDRTAASSRRRASASETAPSRRMRGSAPARSMTVDAVPGSRPPSTTAAAFARMSSGTA